jgi:hypothetical protein
MCVPGRRPTGRVRQILTLRTLYSLADRRLRPLPGHLVRLVRLVRTFLHRNTNLPSVQRFRALLDPPDPGHKLVMARLPFTPEKVWGDPPRQASQGHHRLLSLPAAHQRVPTSRSFWARCGIRGSPLTHEAAETKCRKIGLLALIALLAHFLREASRLIAKSSQSHQLPIAPRSPGGQIILTKRRSAFRLHLCNQFR